MAAETETRATPLANENLNKIILELIQLGSQYKQIKCGANESRH